MSKFLQLNLSCFVTVFETSYWVKFYLPDSPPPKKRKNKIDSIWHRRDLKAKSRNN